VLDSVLLFFAAEHAPAAAVDVHCLEELLLSIHALELNVSIAAVSWVVLLVLIAVFQNFPGLLLQGRDFDLHFCLGFVGGILLF